MFCAPMMQSPPRDGFRACNRRGSEERRGAGINGSMYRLDLHDSMARAAQEAGVLLAIDSDAHSVAQLDQIRYSVFQARRGWMEAR